MQWCSCKSCSPSLLSEHPAKAVPASCDSLGHRMGEIPARGTSPLNSMLPVAVLRGCTCFWEFSPADSLRATDKSSASLKEQVLFLEGGWVGLKTSNEKKSWERWCMRVPLHCATLYASCTHPSAFWGRWSTPVSLQNLQTQLSFLYVIQ